MYFYVFQVMAYVWGLTFTVPCPKACGIEMSINLKKIRYTLLQDWMLKTQSKEYILDESHLICKELAVEYFFTVCFDTDSNLCLMKNASHLKFKPAYWEGKAVELKRTCFQVRTPSIVI